MGPVSLLGWGVLDFFFMGGRVRLKGFGGEIDGVGCEKL